MIRNIVNISANSVTLADFNGVTLSSGESIDGLMFGEEALRTSNSVMVELLAGTIAINDGIQTYYDGQSINLIRGLPTRVSLSGAAITTASDRPEGCKISFTSCGDDIVNNIDNGGNQLLFNVPAGETQTIDVFYNRDMYIKQGEIYYINAELGSYVDVKIVVPAGLPFPAPANNGNFDLVNTTWTPNANNTGKFFITNVETLLITYVHKYPLLSVGQGRGSICSPEPDLLPTGYGLRLNVHNAHTTDALKAAIVLFMYKPIPGTTN